MPELPEVETIRRQLAPLVEGRVFELVEVLDSRWSRPIPPAEVAAALTGRRIMSLGRRGKYLTWRLDNDALLAQHLRMTGTILCDADPEPEHTRVRFRLTPAPDGRPASTVALVDPRRFGTGQLLLGPEAAEAFFSARLGLEPLTPEFTADHLRELARGRRAPIKAFLLDQRRIAGIGNIYADEALYRAKVHPLRPTGRLTRQQYDLLRDAIVASLNAGIAAKGATIDDFRHIDGVRGSFQDQFLVHRRAGEPCGRCGAPIVKIVAAGRGTYVCETCQRRPRLPRRAAQVRPRQAASSSSRRPLARAAAVSV